MPRVTRQAPKPRWVVFRASSVAHSAPDQCRAYQLPIGAKPALAFATSFGKPPSRNSQPQRNDSQPLIRPKDHNSSQAAQASDGPGRTIAQLPLSVATQAAKPRSFFCAARSHNFQAAFSSNQQGKCHRHSKRLCIRFRKLQCVTPDLRTSAGMTFGWKKKVTCGPAKVLSGRREAGSLSQAESERFLL